MALSLLGCIGLRSAWNLLVCNKQAIQHGLKIDKLGTWLCKYQLN